MAPQALGAVVNADGYGHGRRRPAVAPFGEVRGGSASRVYRADGAMLGVRPESTRRVVYTGAGVLSYLSTS